MREQGHRRVDGRSSLTCRHKFRIDRIAGSAPLRGRLVERSVLKGQDLVEGVEDPLRELEVPGASTLGTPLLSDLGTDTPARASSISFMANFCMTVLLVVMGACIQVEFPRLAKSAGIVGLLSGNARNRANLPKG